MPIGVEQFSEAQTHPTPRKRTGAEAHRRVPKTRRNGLLLSAIAIAPATLTVGISACVRPTSGLAPAPARRQIVVGSRPNILTTAITPDGSALIYGDTAPENQTQLLLRERGEAQARTLVTGSFVIGPSFSPDGRSVAFVNGKTLERIPRAGGTAVVLSDQHVCCSTAWLENGMVVALAEAPVQVLVTPADSGPTRIVLKTDNLFGPITPIPGRDAVLVSVLGSEPVVLALDLATGETRRVRSNAVAAWVVDDLLLYAEPNGTLYAAPFDSRRLEVTGSAVPVLDSIRTRWQLAQVAVGRDGTLLYVPGAVEGTSLWDFPKEIVRVALDGSATPIDTALSVPVNVNGGLDLSPNGRRLAFSVDDTVAKRSDIYLLDLQSGALTRFTFDGTANIRPQWSPDGRRILYVSDRGADGKSQLWANSVDSGGAPSLVASDPRQVFGGLWSPDGRWVVYRTDDGAAGRGDILAVRTDGNTTRIAVAATPATEYGGAFSPDGRWIAYSSNIDGRQEVYVRAFPDTSGATWKVSTDGGYSPQWSHDGTKLYYRPGEVGPFMQASVVTTPSFAVTGRTPLFENVPYVTRPFYHTYAVTLDDRHFIMVRSRPDPTPSEHRMITIDHWLPALRAKVEAANR